MVVVCGLGPGSADLVTLETANVLRESEVLFVRTRRHPNAHLAARGVSFDDLYQQSDSFDDVYRRIADRVVGAAIEHGSATYCVPGSPLVLERSVQNLRSRPEIEVRMLPAISFLDEVWSRLGVDPVDDGVRLIDGHRFEVEAAGERGPLLVAHAHARWVLSAIKLALAESDAVSADLPVIVLQRLGTSEERIIEVRWSELDRSVEPDHLTSLYLPRFEAPLARALTGSVELMRRLRLECPWDRSQDHASLRRFLIEEAYEVVDALDRVVESVDRCAGEATGHSDDAAVDGTVVAVPPDVIDAYAELESELGDLLFQILFHARLAAEAGQFDVSDVAQTLIDKMVGRHPHVFGARNPSLFSRPDPAEESVGHDEEQWERTKAEQSGRSSILDGIPRSLPSLPRSSKIMKRIVDGFGPPQPGRRLESLLDDDLEADDVGHLLLAVVELARRLGVDPELALRDALHLTERSVRHHETAAVDAGLEWVIG